MAKFKEEEIKVGDKLTFNCYGTHVEGNFIEEVELDRLKIKTTHDIHPDMHGDEQTINKSFLKLREDPKEVDDNDVTKTRE